MSSHGFHTTILFFCILFTFQFATAQGDSIAKKKKEIRSYGGGLQHGFIFAHSEAVENTKGSRPTGVELILSKQRIDSAIWQLCNCYPRRGLLFSYYDYDNKVLGKSVTAAYFLEPVYRISNRLSFSFKGATGFSYLSNPFDSVKNPTNMSYSSHISGYLLLGAGIWWQLNDQWSLNTSVNYQHESNGGLRQPNKGINWPTAGIAVSYQPESFRMEKRNRLREKFKANQPARWDVTPFITARRDVDEAGKSNRLMLLGLSVQAAKQVGRISNLTLGLEASTDEELRLELKRDSIDVSAVLVGLMAGHEFILGKILFSQRLGVYLFDKTPYFDRLYHRWGLMYRINDHWSAGFSMKAHRHIADYADLRVSYSF